ncbi:MAG: NfeD family protein [Burkholderiales bacterium]|nr:NfeD family protein [Burkholderiales bacterium]
MEEYLLWFLAGIALIIAELLTGTFYLLVLGVAALAGGGTAYLGFSFWAQAVVAVAAAVIGVLLVGRYRSGAPEKNGATQHLDVGQSVLLDSWVSEAEGLARVSYRNALWNARVEGAHASGDKVFYIRAVDGNTLHVSVDKPA